MDLGIVLTGNTQHVDHFADGRVGVLGPLHNLDDDLVASLAASEFVQRDENISGQELAVGRQLGEVLQHLQRADKHLFLAFQNLHYLGLGFHAVACSADVYQHAVTVQGVHRVALGHHDGLAVIAGGIDTVLAVTAPDENALGHRRTAGSLVAARAHRHQEAVDGQLVQDLDNECAALGRVGTHCR